MARKRARAAPAEAGRDPYFDDLARRVKFKPIETSNLPQGDWLFDDLVLSSSIAGVIALSLADAPVTTIEECRAYLAELHAIHDGLVGALHDVAARHKLEFSRSRLDAYVTDIFERAGSMLESFPSSGGSA